MIHVKNLILPNRFSYNKTQLSNATRYKKNRMISAKNRLSTSAQAPTAAASATIPYSYLTLSVRLRERISDRERSMCKT